MSLSEELADTIISKIPPPPEVVFPDVQKVEVTNFPEQKAPVVNVTVPEIKIPPITVPEPKVTVHVPDVVIPENTSQNAILGEIKALLAKEPEKFDEESFFERLGEVLKDKVNIKEAMRGFQSSGWLPVVGAMTDGTQKSILRGTLDDGTATDLASTEEGHLEVAIHSPRLPFGSVHTEKLTPVIQSDGVYGINSLSMVTSTGLGVGTGANSASVTASGNKLVLATGAPSSTNIDTAATGMTSPTTSQILWSRAVTQSGDFEYGFTDREITLQPGESVTLCVKSLTATADCSGALNTREDQ